MIRIMNACKSQIKNENKKIQMTKLNTTQNIAYKHWPENGKYDGMKFEITSHDLLKVLSLLLLKQKKKKICFVFFFSVTVYGLFLV